MLGHDLHGAVVVGERVGRAVQDAGDSVDGSCLDGDGEDEILGVVFVVTCEVDGQCSRSACCSGLDLECVAFVGQHGACSSRVEGSGDGAGAAVVVDVGSDIDCLSGVEFSGVAFSVSRPCCGVVVAF